MGRKDSGDDVSVRIGDVLAAFGFPVGSKISRLGVRGEKKEGEVGRLETSEGLRFKAKEARVVTAVRQC